MISVCLVTADYYMSYPIKDLDVIYSDFRGSEVRQVPILQIFGSTSTGQKVCLHIHGVFPYIYIPYDGIESADMLKYKLAIEIDKALNVSLGQASSNAQHVYNVILVSGIPIYGYHEKEHQFFKIYFYNPGIIKKTCALLENGAILGKHFQPHESHINYVLQFMIDYNLHGMTYINLSTVKYRYNTQNERSLQDISPDLILPLSIQKRSISEIEIDAFATDILNKQEIESGELMVNPGLAALWEEEKQRKRNKDMDSQISFCLTQNRKNIKSTSTHQFFKNLLHEKLKSSKDTNDNADLNKSVYPAETPDNSVILTASSTNITSLDSTIVNESIIESSQPENYNLNESILPLFEILCDLKERNQIETDSILSQQIDNDENQEIESSDEEVNLSLPLKIDESDEVWHDSFWEDCKISQLDGNNDSSEDCFSFEDDDEYYSQFYLTSTSDSSTDEEVILKCYFCKGILKKYCSKKSIRKSIEFSNIRYQNKIQKNKLNNKIQIDSSNDEKRINQLSVNNNTNLNRNNKQRSDHLNNIDSKNESSDILLNKFNHQEESVCKNCGRNNFILNGICLNTDCENLADINLDIHKNTATAQNNYTKCNTNELLNNLSSQSETLSANSDFYESLSCYNCGRNNFIINGICLNTDCAGLEHYSKNISSMTKKRYRKKKSSIQLQDSNYSSDSTDSECNTRLYSKFKKCSRKKSFKFRQSKDDSTKKNIHSVNDTSTIYNKENIFLQSDSSHFVKKDIMDKNIYKENIPNYIINLKDNNKLSIVYKPKSINNIDINSNNLLQKNDRNFSNSLKLDDALSLPKSKCSKNSNRNEKIIVHSDIRIRADSNSMVTWTLNKKNINVSIEDLDSNLFINGQTQLDSLPPKGLNSLFDEIDTLFHNNNYHSNENFIESWIDNNDTTNEKSNNDVILNDVVVTDYKNLNTFNNCVEQSNDLDFYTKYLKSKNQLNNSSISVEPLNNFKKSDEILELPSNLNTNENLKSSSDIDNTNEILEVSNNNFDDNNSKEIAEILRKIRKLESPLDGNFDLDSDESFSNVYDTYFNLESSLNGNFQLDDSIISDNSLNSLDENINCSREYSLKNKSTQKIQYKLQSKKSELAKTNLPFKHKIEQSRIIENNCYHLNKNCAICKTILSSPINNVRLKDSSNKLLACEKTKQIIQALHKNKFNNKFNSEIIANEIKTVKRKRGRPKKSHFNCFKLDDNYVCLCNEKSYPVQIIVKPILKNKESKYDELLDKGKDMPLIEDAFKNYEKNNIEAGNTNDKRNILYSDLHLSSESDSDICNKKNMVSGIKNAEDNSKFTKPSQKFLVDNENKINTFPKINFRIVHKNTKPKIKMFNKNSKLNKIKKSIHKENKKFIQKTKKISKNMNNNMKRLLTNNKNIIQNKIKNDEMDSVLNKEDAKSNLRISNRDNSQISVDNGEVTQHIQKNHLKDASPVGSIGEMKSINKNSDEEIINDNNNLQVEIKRNYENLQKDIKSDHNNLQKDIRSTLTLTNHDDLQNINFNLQENINDCCEQASIIKNEITDHKKKKIKKRRRTAKYRLEYFKKKNKERKMKNYQVKIQEESTIIKNITDKPQFTYDIKNESPLKNIVDYNNTVNHDKLIKTNRKKSIVLNNSTELFNKNKITRSSSIKQIKNSENDKNMYKISSERDMKSFNVKQAQIKLIDIFQHNFRSYVPENVLQLKNIMINDLCKINLQTDGQNDSSSEDNISRTRSKRQKKFLKKKNTRNQKKCSANNTEPKKELKILIPQCEIDLCNQVIRKIKDSKCFLEKTKNNKTTECIKRIQTKEKDQIQTDCTNTKFNSVIKNNLKNKDTKKRKDISDIETSNASKKIKSIVLRSSSVSNCTKNGDLFPSCNIVDNKKPNDFDDNKIEISSSNHNSTMMLRKGKLIKKTFYQNEDNSKNNNDTKKSKTKIEKPDVNTTNKKSRINFVTKSDIIKNDVIINSSPEETIKIQCSSSSADSFKLSNKCVTKTPSPKKNYKKKLNSSPKYNKLNIIVKSPRKCVIGSEKKDINVQSTSGMKTRSNLDYQDDFKNISANCSNAGELESVQIFLEQNSKTMVIEDKIKEFRPLSLNNESEASTTNCDKSNISSTVYAFNENEKLKTISENKNKINSIKRNLYFPTNNLKLNTTIMEEKQICTYEPIEKKIKIKRLNYTVEQKYWMREEKFIEDIQKEEKAKDTLNKNLIKEDNCDVMFNLNFKNSNESLLSDNVNVSGFQAYKKLKTLSVSEQYDIKNNFFPKPCCSKYLDIIETNIKSNSSDEYENTTNFDILVKDPNFISQQIAEYQTYGYSDDIDNTDQNINSNQLESYPSYDPTESANITLIEDDLPYLKYKHNQDTFDTNDSFNSSFHLAGEVSQNNDSLDMDDILAVNNLNRNKLIDQVCSDKKIIMQPLKNPPTSKDLLLTLSKFNIPVINYPQPFYSDPTDVTGKKDVGHNVLKIPSKSILDLDEFQSSINFNGLEKWRASLLNVSNFDLKKNNIKLMLAGTDVRIIMPNIRPPTRNEILEWLKIKVNNEKINESPKKKNEKIRLHIPLSPGNESMDETMTISPCSPLEMPSGHNSSVESTPVTSSVNDTISPTLNHRRINRKRGNLQRKALFKQTILSQKTDVSDKQGTSDIETNISKKKNQTRDLDDLIHALSHRLSGSSKSDDEKIKIENEQVGDMKSSIDYNKLKLSDLNITTESPIRNDSCQITGATLNNTHGFKMSNENLQNAKALSVIPHLTVMVVEIHTVARGDLTPDPNVDSVRAIFYSILYDSINSPDKQITGILVTDTLPGSPNQKAQKRPILDGTGTECEITYTKSEIELMDEFVKLIRKWDPDIFAGFEIEMFSWGYLIQRCYVLGVNLPILISRLNPDVVKHRNIDPEDLHDMKIPGRIILDVWRLLRHEVALQSYTFENIMYHILHQRVALHSYKDLSFWWEHRSNNYRRITVNYYLIRVEGVLKILDQLDLIGRTCELAKLFGIQFYEVLSRGSQFRVESIMLRLAKPQNYIPVSPSVQQRAKMRAPEWLPLILEPESRLYTDPIIVLDFQSLYPSIIIAYNYCFSTCIGRVEKLGTSYPFEFGASQLKLPPGKLRKLENKINFSPCGVGFVRPEVRKGILPRMLQEILETRLMVKNSMKENKDNKLLQRVLHSRQLGLKLIANVTYGYTAANFSGRMPCIEVGDSVVSKGRETLERAIKMIESNSEWGARVVYGDTDSLFVLVPGKTRTEAFKIGQEIADSVTNDNPSPVKLKLEKIYHPSILQTKKRYVGYMYESPDQKDPEYNAKGIETVRRDGCPAVAKILEKCLRMLFETRDVSLIKKYVCRQFGKLLMGRASIQDLIFAKEYRGASGYRPGACVPALELAKKWRNTDKRKEPRRGQRVPYIIVNGPPGLPLIKLVRSPYELLGDVTLKPNALYYITKVIIPPVNRCFTLFGADLNIWFNEMPRKQIQALPNEIELLNNNKKSTISQYFSTSSCVVCSNQTRKGLCDVCLSNPQSTVITLNYKIHNWEQRHLEVNKICQSCCSLSETVECLSLDCPVLYRLNQTKRDLNQSFFVRNLFINF